MQHKHIILGEEYCQTLPFKSGRGGGKKLPPDRNRIEQYGRLEFAYQETLKNNVTAKSLLQIDDKYKSSGTYLEFEVNGKSIDFHSIDTKKDVKLMNVKKKDEKSDNVTLTIFLPDDSQKWLPSRLEDYNDSSKDNKGKPKQAKLINSIENIASCKVDDFFVIDEEREKFSNYTSDFLQSYELWIDTTNFEFDENDYFERLDQILICHGKRTLNFSNTTVILIKATKSQMTKIPLILDYLSEIRIFRDILKFIELRSYESRDWIKLIKDNVVVSENLVRIGILDSGVSNDHPLLSPYLPNERCHNATLAGPRDLDHHGTLLAGLALYGDLLDVAYSSVQHEIVSDLTSVKIKPGGDETPNEKELYGVITEDAILIAKNDNARILCSAVTEVGDTHGEPTSLSAAVDESLYNRGESDTLFFISAGNTYETTAILSEEVKSPGQAWNAITVGAYTEKCIISNPNYEGITPLAQRRELSPFSTTSLCWNKGIIKPEILMEGGNAIDRNGIIEPVDDLSLISTGATHNVHMFDPISATSAATPLAARLAAKIVHHNPQLSALSIRALMIHSAEWTQQMIDKNIEDNKLNIHSLLHTCGYGVPNENKAIMSDDCNAVFISEQTITPLVANTDGNGYKFGAMHLYELPWPKDVLENMGEAKVTLKITLSFYVQPAPGSKTRSNKYRYPSLALRFDVNKPTEEKKDFVSRVSHIVTDGMQHSDNDTKRWSIGIMERNNGSVISDSIKTSAVDIASCNMIAVYPVHGWWKERKYSCDKSIKYSLVVSLETEETEIYSAIPIAQTIAIET